MKIITQIGIIFTICWISQIIEKVLPFEFPASVIGMILLFLLLVTKVMKVDHIREKSDFLLSNMAFFFLPAGVSIINYFDVLKNCVVQLIIICVVSTVVTFAVTAYSMKLVLWLMNRKKNAREAAVVQETKAADHAAAVCGKETK
ncbi:MAG: CidA/LrgA family protein [Lachnospiraceae bacterium]|nr:CidA/LrgA family protein [Lachnospiraceae bacterium]